MAFGEHVTHNKHLVNLNLKKKKDLAYIKSAVIICWVKKQEEKLHYSVYEKKKDQ